MCDAGKMFDAHPSLCQTLRKPFLARGNGRLQLRTFLCILLKRDAKNSILVPSAEFHVHYVQSVRSGSSCGCPSAFVQHSRHQSHSSDDPRRLGSSSFKSKTTCSLFREFAPNKKWAVSPLISPPAGLPTANTADKLVRIPRILLIATKLNVHHQFAVCFSPIVRSMCFYSFQDQQRKSWRPLRKAVSIDPCGDEVDVPKWMFSGPTFGPRKGHSQGAWAGRSENIHF